jgi:microcystin-dependent protein
MSEPFLSEIVMVGCSFAPRGWAFCDGQLMAISQYSALFSLLGTTFGGDGRTTFGLPDMRGRCPIHAGTGPGLTQRRLGQKSGAETHTLNLTQIPSHGHNVGVTARGTSNGGSSNDPTGRVLGATRRETPYADADTGDMAAGAIAVTQQNAGGNQSHNNMQPFQCVNFGHGSPIL